MNTIYRKTILCFGVLMFNVLLLSAQSWKQLSKEAAAFFQNGQYAEAAEAFERAFEKKRNKKILLHKAAKAWFNAGEYDKSADRFKTLAGDEAFPRAGLGYARSLKAQGLYETAKSAFKDLKKSPNLPADVQLQIDNEIEGCTMALTQPSDSGAAPPLPLDDAINSAGQEYAPIPFDSGILYFTASKDGAPQFFRSRLEGGNWSQAITPKLPKTDGAITQGSFSPDGTRFYFTICPGSQMWKGIPIGCELHVIERRGNQWTSPVRLRDYIKMEGTTALYPNVVQEGDVETLYFVSDRPDGFGGLDIWFVTRNINSNVYDFTFPQNLGSLVNTPADEITPFYDQHSGRLFFSSDGHPSYGGMDVFSVAGKQAEWSLPQNAGSTINSSADEIGYTIETKSGERFLVSNRKTAKKISTDWDIYALSGSANALSISGKVNTIHAADKSFKATLYELYENGTQRLLAAKNFETPAYHFAVLPDKRFRLIVEKTGFRMAKHDFDTYDGSVALQQKDFELSIAGTTAPATSRSTTPPVATTSPTANASTTSTSVITTAPPSPTPTVEKNKTYAGTYFKVQLTVVVDFNEYAPQYDAIRAYGHLDTEYLADRGWTRILLSPFFSLQEARSMMKKARKMGYPDAFPVRYRDGKRMTP